MAPSGSVGRAARRACQAAAAPAPAATKTAARARAEVKETITIRTNLEQPHLLADFALAAKRASCVLIGVLFGCQQPGAASEAKSLPAPQATNTTAVVEPRAPEDQKVPPLGAQRATLTRMPLGSPNQTAEIGVSGDDERGWSLSVSLATLPAQAPLRVSWPLSSPVAHPASDVELPAGDPLKPLRGAGGWSFGADAATSLVALGTVRLSGDQRALLVSQEAGFEHRKRRHDLVVVGNAGLRVAWSAIDPPGPAWSTVVVRAKDDQSDEILLVSTFESTQAGEVDRVEVSRLAWDARRADLISSAVACEAGVYLAISRVFASLDGAIAAKSEPCSGAPVDAPLPSELVLPAPPRSKLKGYVLAQVSTEQSLARQALIDAAHCWHRAKPALVPWCPTQNK